MGFWAGTGLSHCLRECAGCRQLSDRSLGRFDLYRHQEPHPRGDRTESDFLCGFTQPPGRKPDDHHAHTDPQFERRMVRRADRFHNFSFNWENGGAPTIPLGMQVGKVVRIGKQPMSMSIEAGGAAARPSGVPNPGLILGFEVSPIFNFHLGPGREGQGAGQTRVELRGQRNCHGNPAPPNPISPRIADLRSFLTCSEMRVHRL